MISEVARNTISERGERAAMQPDFKLPEDEKEADQVLAGRADLTYTMSYEVLPKVELQDFKSISVERPVAEPEGGWTQLRAHDEMDAVFLPFLARFDEAVSDDLNTPVALTVLAVLGVQIAGLLVGAVVVEQLFALPGVGRMLVTDVGRRDVTKVQSELLVLTGLVLLVGFAVDVVHRALDPRQREVGS